MKRWHTGLQVALLLALTMQVWASSLQVHDRLSAWNQSRPIRRQTRFIILHTTEGSTIGALEKLRRNGEAHYLVDERGIVYRIIERRRVALHAGRSMWQGTTNLDDHSIGIEVTGYHNRPVTAAQIRALRSLLGDLQRHYRIPDENVMPHSMVAYGTPNRWHRRSHRGRKRCGMQFADRTVRQQLGLNRQQLFDPDVRAGRLIEADPYLASVLYRSARPPAQPVQQPVSASAVATVRTPSQPVSQPSSTSSVAVAQPPVQPASTSVVDVAQTAIQPGEEGNVISRNRSAWDIARDLYREETTIYIFPDGTEIAGSEIKDWRRIPAGTRVEMRHMEGASSSENAADDVLEIGVHGANARELAGEEILAATTIYFLIDGRVRQGKELSEEQVDALPNGTRMLVGYVHGGYVTARRSAFDIAGAKWNHISTFYRRPDGVIVTGDKLNEGSIVPMSMIFFQR
jgi:N-acetylmuramoyl-L-alanine amidase